MANYAIGVYSGAAQADTTAQPSTIVVRDSSSGIAAAQVLGSELKTSAILTLPAPVAKTTTFTADGTTVVYEVDGTGGAFNATLEAAAAVTGRIHIFIRTNTAGSAVTVKGNASELINGSNTYALSAQYKWVMVISNGTSWDAFGN